MINNKTIIIGICLIFSILFIIGCQGSNSSNSNSSSKSSNSSSSSKLDKMCDEYKRMADRMIRATQSNDFAMITSSTNEITGWMSKWENEIKNNSCSQQEMLNASNRMMSIAQSLLSY